MQPADYIERLLADDPGVNPLMRHLNAKAVEITPDRAVVTCTAAPELMQGAGVLAGGVIATLLDEAMAYVVLARLEKGRSTATVDMNIRYFRPVMPGAETVATAWVQTGGRKVITTESELSILTDGGGEPKVAAKASAAFMVL